jgi:hypothetical protein
MLLAIIFKTIHDANKLIPSSAPNRTAFDICRYMHRFMSPLFDETSACVHIESHIEPITFCQSFILYLSVLFLIILVSEKPRSAIERQFDSFHPLSQCNALQSQARSGSNLRTVQSPTTTSVGSMMHPTISSPIMPAFAMWLRNIGNHLHSTSGCPLAEYPKY